MRHGYFSFLGGDTSWKSVVSLFTISNILTLLRILITPVIVFGIVDQAWFFVFILFIVAGLTDMLDGYFARKFAQGTALGAYLDPIADKILLLSSFAALSFVDSPSFFVPKWFFFLILSREMLIVGGSALLLLLGVRPKIAPSMAGRMTTFFQLCFIWWLFMCYFFGWNPVKTYFVTTILLALFSIASLAQYSVIGFRYLKRK